MPVGYVLVPAALVLLAGMVTDHRGVRVASASSPASRRCCSNASGLPEPALHELNPRRAPVRALHQQARARGSEGLHEVRGRGRGADGKPPVLCVVVGGRQADEILDDSNGEIDAEDVASDLNSQGIEPREVPKSIGVDGLTLVSARWS